jgi:hypothetical protein
LGNPAALGASAIALTDSNQGSAIVQPAPRSTARREKAREIKGERGVVMANPPF